jgi:hypothetical protein
VLLELATWNWQRHLPDYQIVIYLHSRHLRTGKRMMELSLFLRIVFIEDQNYPKSEDDQMHLSTRTVSRALVLAVFMILSGDAAHAYIQENQAETLTNRSVVEMVQAHLDVDVIVEHIRTSPGKFLLTTINLIALKRQGVPGSVIAAMQAKMAASARSPADPQEPAVPLAVSGMESPISQANGGSIEKWRVQKSVNHMTDQVDEVLVAQVRGDPKGSFAVGAACSDDTGIGFTIASATPGVLLKRTPMTQTMTAKERFGGGIEGQVSPPQSCAVMQLRVGYGQVQDVVSNWCGSDSYATLEFYGNLEKRVRQNSSTVNGAMRAMAGPASDDGILGTVMTGLNQLQAQAASRMPDVMTKLGVAQMSDVVSAIAVRIKLPLADGSSSMIEFHPQDPVFKK